MYSPYEEVTIQSLKDSLDFCEDRGMRESTLNVLKYYMKKSDYDDFIKNKAIDEDVYEEDTHLLPTDVLVEEGKKYLMLKGNLQANDAQMVTWSEIGKNVLTT